MWREEDFYVTLVRLTCDNGFDTKERDDATDERRRLVFVSSSSCSCTIDERIYSSRVIAVSVIDEIFIQCTR